jgi:uridine kinase
VQAFESVSTWRQPTPPPASAARTALLAEVASRIDRLSPGRLRVAVDGLTGAGKTGFGHELAAALRGMGRVTMRASLDDFKNPWGGPQQLGYDRFSGEGYYRNAHDLRSARDLLLGPAGQGGSGEVVLCSRDPLTGEEHQDISVTAPAGAILIVDSVFAFRPEYNDCWEYRIWLEADPGLAMRRGIRRDAPAEGLEEAIRLHRDRYRVAEMIYLTEVCPQALADLIVENQDFAHPRILSRPGT